MAKPTFHIGDHVLADGQPGVIVYIYQDPGTKGLVAVRLESEKLLPPLAYFIDDLSVRR